MEQDNIVKRLQQEIADYRRQRDERLEKIVEGLEQQVQQLPVLELRLERAEERGRRNATRLRAMELKLAAGVAGGGAGLVAIIIKAVEVLG